MKKILTASIILFCAVILFFSLFGEKLYYSTKPVITLCRADGIIDGDGNIKIVIPKSCVFEGKYVYGISSYPGFSLTIYSVVRQEAKTEPNPEDESTVIVNSGVRQGQILVKSASKKLTDGAQVVLK